MFSKQTTKFEKMYLGVQMLKKWEIQLERTFFLIGREFKVNLLYFWLLYGLVFDLETIGS